MLVSTPATGTTPSFKNLLLNHMSKQKGNEEDLSIQDEDVTMNRIGPFPSISFSDKIHWLLNDSMKYVVVIKMLGCNIRYKDLRDKEVSMWKLLVP
ncbi:hypothetical protein K1719_039924 [Acacia pycnantha]|nr:hypothetical protein K1719_039924 [Acacia pycnantha]